MPARILGGKAIADEILAEVASGVAAFRCKCGAAPKLVVVRVGDDQASAVYVTKKIKTSEELGIASEHLRFESNVSTSELVTVVRRLNERDDVDGILVQLPLPDHVGELEILENIDPQKDVDGFHPSNAGRLMQGDSVLAPCTPAGVMEILKRSNIEIAGRHAVIVGRSNIVGKPMAMMLLAADATVTVCHSRTVNLAELTRQAEILIAAIGRPGMIGDEHIGLGATVIDVGINPVSDKAMVKQMFDGDELGKRLDAITTRGSTLVGDVNPRAARDRAAAYTPVPGGVGLLTIAMLMKNTLTAALLRRSL